MFQPYYTFIYTYYAYKSKIYFRNAMMIIHSLVKIITTHTNTLKKKIHLVKTCLRTFATLRHNYIQETTSILPQDASIFIHTISNTNLKHAYTKKKKKKVTQIST